MKIKIPIRTTVETDLHQIDAFRILCRVLDMSYVMNEYLDFSVEPKEDGRLGVYLNHEDGKKDLYDERGELFTALRNVAVCMVPNLSFRDADYIYSK